jgi:uncharacterized protein (DUF1501 family)
MPIDRRSLIQRSCLTAASFAAFPRWAAAGLFRERSRERAAADPDTVLVVIQLNGGNDGLNTLVPFADPVYLTARPLLALPGSETLRLDAKSGLHPSLANLYRYLGSGQLAIIQSVGYPGPDMSHFRSDDIWESAVPDRVEATGWLGRALKQIYGEDTEQLRGASFSGDVTAFHDVPVMSDPGSFRYYQDDPALAAALPAMLTPTGQPNRAYVGHIGELAVADVGVVQQALAQYTSSVVYPPDSGFAGSLQQIVALIAADVGPRIFFTGQGGYDTHSSQLGDQAKLLAELDQSLDAFYRDLVAHGLDKRVVVMTYSEFGRRVEDNGSGGTDHGTANLMFVLGTGVRGGLYGKPPSLKDLDPDGNLKFTTDLRTVYGSILANWIDTDPTPVVGDFPTLPFV